MIALLRGHLLEDRADPDGRNAQPLQIADLRLEAAQRPADEPVAGLDPLLPVIRGRGGIAAIARLEERCGAGRDQSARVVPVVVLASIRVAIEHQEIEHLVFPGDRRRVERPALCQGSEVDVTDPHLHHALLPNLDIHHRTNL